MRKYLLFLLLRSSFIIHELNYLLGCFYFRRSPLSKYLILIRICLFYIILRLNFLLLKGGLYYLRHLLSLLMLCMFDLPLRL
jgi:hypothetical protein